MSKKEHRLRTLLLLSVAALALSACGTLQIEPLAETSGAQPASAPAETTTPGGAAPTREQDLEEAPPTGDPLTASGETAKVTEVVATPEAMSTGDSAHNQGMETLLLPGCYDFDNGASLAPPDCDFNFLPGPDSGRIAVYPVAPAQLAYGAVFSDEPDQAQCAASDAFSGEPENVAPLAAMYVCYRTGEGRTGYLHFTSADLERAYSATFQWLTYALQDDDDAPAAGDGLVYRNDAFGFQLPLPETWSGYDVTQNEHDGGASICFTFVGSTPVCVLQIDVYSQAAWSALETVPDGYYVAENSDFVFAAGPHRAQCVQMDEFQCVRYQEIPTILEGLVTE